MNCRDMTKKLLNSSWEPDKENMSYIRKNIWSFWFWQNSMHDKISQIFWAKIYVTRVPLKPMLGGVRVVAHFHYPTCTDLIKPCLLFSCKMLFLCFLGITSFQIFEEAMWMSKILKYYLDDKSRNTYF
jgi:hypothetical protein